MTIQELINAACAYSESGQRTSQGVPLNHAERAKLKRIAKRYKLTPTRALRFLILKADQEITDTP